MHKFKKTSQNFCVWYIALKCEWNILEEGQEIQVQKVEILMKVAQIHLLVHENPWSYTHRLSWRANLSAMVTVSKENPACWNRKHVPSCILLRLVVSRFPNYLASRKQCQLVRANPIFHTAESFLLSDTDGVPVGRYKVNGMNGVKFYKTLVSLTVGYLGGCHWCSGSWRSQSVLCRMCGIAGILGHGACLKIKKWLPFPNNTRKKSAHPPWFPHSSWVTLMSNMRAIATVAPKPNVRVAVSPSFAPMSMYTNWKDNKCIRHMLAPYEIWVITVLSSVQTTYSWSWFACWRRLQKYNQNFSSFP